MCTLGILVVYQNNIIILYLSMSECREFNQLSDAH